MNIPHDPVALEEHFKDDDKGPLSNQGYMPYLNKFVLDKVGTKMQKEWQDNGRLFSFWFSAHYDIWVSVLVQRSFPYPILKIL